jgi:hypothetical protein
MKTWQCLICGVPFPGNALGEHFRMSHPELNWQPEQWVNGQPVIYDEEYDI